MVGGESVIAGSGAGSGNSIATEVWRPDLDERERDRLTEILQELADDPFLRQVAARSLALMKLAPGQRVLDVGCGSGVLLPALAQAIAPAGRVVGFDYAAAFLEEARVRVDGAGVGDRVELRSGDAHHLPFPDASFDAAHTERVLMHLDDPDAVLAEMHRVVKPGGWVVAAEPDSSGVRTDHPADPEAMAMISAKDLASFRNPNLGLELNRRMARAGLVERVVEVFTEFDPVYHPVVAGGDRRAAEALVSEGKLSRERADATLAYLEDASERGEYAWIGSMVVAAGRVPAAYATAAERGPRASPAPGGKEEEADPAR